MKASIDNPAVSPNGKVVAGIIILIVGSILLLQQFNFFFIPNWLFSWPMFMIAYGVYMGGKYNFRKPIWIWMVVLGSAFLITENVDNADRLVWPIAVIGIGAWMVTKNRNQPVVYADKHMNEI